MDVHGPFDIIGDVHGCAPELLELLRTLGWEFQRADGQSNGATHPLGRRAVFLGDLVDRGPDTPGVLRLVMGMVASGHALYVQGNHEAKLARWLSGQAVSVSAGRQVSIDQLESESADVRERARSFREGLPEHLVLDNGNLVVAHAGLMECHHGGPPDQVRAFALYGYTTGEKDEYGYPIRLPWQVEYRGDAVVAYGHTPVLRAEWVNNTICLDTGVVFGGSLSALRYPEREIVAVRSERKYSTPPAHCGGWWDPVGRRKRHEDVGHLRRG